MSDGSSPGRALAETLRAPLLLSPIADVVAGWSLAVAAGFQPSSALAPASSATNTWALVSACVCGCCLLAAGMAQNALADRADDLRRKPGRPLARGAISVTAVWGAYLSLTIVALVVASRLPDVWPVVALIVGATAAYHYVFKRWRVPGCLALGSLRAADMALGAVAAGGNLDVLSFASTTSLPSSGAGIALAPAAVCFVYGLFITGASLHASTDDERPGSAWSAAGLGLCQAVLIVLLLSMLIHSPRGIYPVLGAAIVGFTVVRLELARRRLPPGPLTGVALSSIFPIGAGLALAAANPLGGLVILGLFAVSRRLMRVFPPT
jgi:4-hydroxybenzoate polyprenyltransferase